MLPWVLIPFMYGCFLLCDHIYRRVLERGRLGDRIDPLHPQKLPHLQKEAPLMKHGPSYETRPLTKHVPAVLLSLSAAYAANRMTTWDRFGTVDERGSPAIRIKPAALCMRVRSASTRGVSIGGL